MIRVFWLCFLGSILFGAEFKKGDLFLPTHFVNQYDQNISMRLESAIVIVAFDRAEYYDINQFLKEKEPEYLEKRDIYYLNDISTMPQSIWDFFVKPQMQTKKFSILLIKDQNISLNINYQENKITLYRITEGKIDRIDFVDSTELGRLLPK